MAAWIINKTTKQMSNNRETTDGNFQGKLLTIKNSFMSGVGKSREKGLRKKC